MCLYGAQDTSACTREARKRQHTSLCTRRWIISDKPPLARLFIKGDKNKEQRTHIHHLNNIRLNLAQEQVEKTTLTDSDPIIKVDATQTENLLNQLSIPNQSRKQHRLRAGKSTISNKISNHLTKKSVKTSFLF